MGKKSPDSHRKLLGSPKSVASPPSLCRNFQRNTKDPIEGKKPLVGPKPAASPPKLSVIFLLTHSLKQGAPSSSPTKTNMIKKQKNLLQVSFTTITSDNTKVINNLQPTVSNLCNVNTLQTTRAHLTTSHQTPSNLQSRHIKT